MPPGIIDRIQAVTPAATKPFKNMPVRLTADAVVGTLRALGLAIPTSLATAVAAGQPLRAAAHRFPLKEIDAALTQANVPITDRFRFKEAMSQNGILGN